MSSLYRDYRPKNFKEILGQKHIKTTLQNEISTGHISHAFLFCGPRAVGKTTMARVMAKAVNCQNKKEGESEPCLKCDNCLAISQGQHLDIIEIDAASNTGVDNVRENIITFSRMSPSKAKYKVFIIDEVHMLSASAFNALLKTIEEPPSYVIFVLCTTEVHKVPETIVSRCERYDFNRINISDIVSKLENISKLEKREVETEVLEAVARRSGGHLRDAESLLGQLFAIGQDKISAKDAELIMPHYNNNEVIKLIAHLSEKDSAKSLELINSLADSGANIKNFITETISILRKIVIEKISPELSSSLGLNLGDALEKRLGKTSEKLSIQEVVSILKRLLQAENEKNQELSQLPLELAVIDICLQASTSSFKNQASTVSVNETSRVGVSKQINESRQEKNRVVKTDLEARSEVENIENKTEERKVTLDKVDFTASQIMDKWPEFLIKIKKHNHSLSFVLQNCEPEGVSAGILTLAFKYKFHSDRVQDVSIKKLIEETLAEVYGSNFSLESKLDENMSSSSASEEVNDVTEPIKDESQQILEKEPEENKKNSDTLMNNILNTLGGEVIN